MTALVDGLRSWWRHRNDPPPMLPDKVTWTQTVPTQMLARYPECAHFVAWVNRNETHDGHGWQLASVTSEGPVPDGMTRVVLVRFDGAYRWRDDGFVGF